MQLLENEVKQLIIESLQLEDLSIEDIDTHAALFGEGLGLGLDSIDALELGMAIQKKYSISLLANSEETRNYFSSVSSLANMINQLRKQ
jgi:acyl carrier protein